MKPKTLKSKDTALLIHIEHSQPVEVSDFIKTLGAVSGLFSQYVSQAGDSAELSQAHLYVEKIEKGSIDIYLCETITATLLQFADNANTILDFSAYISRIVNYFTKGTGHKPDLNLKQCRLTKDIFAITAGDNNGITSIGAVSKADTKQVFNNCTFNFTESNSAQNQLEKTIKDLRLNDTSGKSDIRQRQLMKIYQVRSDMNDDKGNKAVIDAVSPRKINLVFQTDTLKARILGGKDNPFRKAFLVDIELMTIEGRLTAYKVTALHDIIDLDPD